MAQFSSSFFLLLFSTGSLLANQNDTLLYADLNGDTVSDTIHVTSTADSYDVLNGCTITINGHMIGLPLEDVYQVEVAVEDIDDDDGQRELILTTIGSGNTVDHRVVRLSGTGPVVSTPLLGSLTFPGQGLVQAKQWMGFWSITRNYRLDEGTMSWQIIPQELYELNVAGKITKPVTLFATREPKAKSTAKLKPKDLVTIVGCIPANPMGVTKGEDWYQIKTATGATGWLQLKDFRDKITLPWEGS